MEGWGDFFVAEVGAAAALAGLLVVAMSINIEKIMALPVLPGRAFQTLVVISAALVMASLALFPAQPLALFGIEAALLGLAVLLVALRQYIHARHIRKDGEPLLWSVLSPLLAAAAALPWVVGGILLIAGNGAGLYCIAAGVIVSFLVTLQHGWVLLVEILR